MFGVEKLVLSKLYEEGSNKRIFNIDRHVGMVTARTNTHASALNVSLHGTFHHIETGEFVSIFQLLQRPWRTMMHKKNPFRLEKN